MKPAKAPGRGGVGLHAAQVRFLKDCRLQSGPRFSRAVSPMPMSQTELEARLGEAFPGADIVVEDLAGDGDHYRARIVSAAFRGLTRIGQHRLVYDALKGDVGGELHALALETSAPAEA